MLLAENLYSQSCQWSRKEEEEKWSKKEEDEEKSEAANRAQFVLKQLLPGLLHFYLRSKLPKQSTVLWQTLSIVQTINSLETNNLTNKQRDSLVWQKRWKRHLEAAILSPLTFYNFLPSSQPFVLWQCLLFNISLVLIRESVPSVNLTPYHAPKSSYWVDFGSREFFIPNHLSQANCCSKLSDLLSQIMWGD